MLHTIPKVGFERRELKIPNHLQQGRLVQITEQYFEEIKRTYDKSVISLSKPTPSENDEERAVTNIGYGEFKERCALASYHKQFQLQMDISKFYHSIYTHSIAWTTEGKLSYKKKIGRDPDTLTPSFLESARTFLARFLRFRPILSPILAG